MKKEFLKSLEDSLKAYEKHGARSNKKLLPLHSFIAKTIEKELNKKLKKEVYTITSLGHGNGKESKLETGKYHSKLLDIAIHKNSEIIVTVSLKSIASNYKQNSHNYFETLLGETANIRRANVGFAHLLVLPTKLPYKEKQGGTKKIEEIESKNLQKYLKLHDDCDFPHKPEVLGIALIDIDRKVNKISYADLDKFGISKKYEQIFDIDEFIVKVIALVQLKS